MGFLSDLFDPGHKDRKRAANSAQNALVKGGTSSGPGGLGAGFAFGEDGTGSQNFSLGSFEPLFQQLQQFGAGQIGAAGGGLPPELQAIFGGAQADLARPNLQGTDLSQQIGGLQQLFGSSLGTATADPFALGQGVSDKLNALAQRGERDMVNNKFDQLFSSGRLGMSVGVQEAYEQQNSNNRAGLNRDLAGLQAGQSLQQNALGSLFGASQGLQGIGAQLFGEQLSGQQLLGQFANQRFGMGAQLQQLLNQTQSQQFAQGTQAVSSAAGLAQLPLAFQSALLQAQGLKSDADLGIAGTHATNAANAKSPFLEALNAVGTFAGNVKPGGF